MGQAILQEWFINRWQTNFRHLFSCWLKRWQGRAQQAALMASTEQDNAPPPECNITPHNWLAQQPPENAILVYISMPSHQIIELRSLPRHRLTDTLDIPMYRNTEAKWAQLNSRSLRRLEFCPANEFVANMQAMEELEFLYCARGHLSAELSNLNLLITTLFAEVCPDLAADADVENANNAGTMEAYNAHEAAKALAMRAAKNQPSQSESAQFAARLCITIGHARSRTKPTNKRQLLAGLLNECRLAREEMAQLDAKFPPVLHKLRLIHGGD